MRGWASRPGAAANDLGHSTPAIEVVNMNDKRRCLASPPLARGCASDFLCHSGIMACELFFFVNRKLERPSYNPLVQVRETTGPSNTYSYNGVDIWKHLR
jgi:hypothetical protein